MRASTTRTTIEIAALTPRASEYTWSHSIVSSAMSVTIVISAKRTSATIAKITPGPANRVARQPPSKAMPVRTTPTVAIVAPAAWSVVRLSPRKTTDSTTVRPPKAATTPLTTEIGPCCSPVK